MSLWWAERKQLDKNQLELIEDLPLEESQLILGPPGSGKTNILLRRAQFVRPSGMARVLVLTFTRPLTEFIRTGCLNSDGSELFPRNAIMTYAGWISGLYKSHGVSKPIVSGKSLLEDRATLASGALGLVRQRKVPKYDTLFVDEAQDLVDEEIQLLWEWSDVLFVVGDSRQHIYGGSNGLETIRRQSNPPTEHTLVLHYRLAPEICEVADRILTSQSGVDLRTSHHYDGPRPARVSASGPQSKSSQLEVLVNQLSRQLRAYDGPIRDGDRLGVVVALKDDRDLVLQALEGDLRTTGKAQILRARNSEDERGYDPTLDPNRPILILTARGCKGLEFRALHWVFVDDGNYYLTAEDYYTVCTRAKTSIDFYYRVTLPSPLAEAYIPPVRPW